MTPDPLRPLTPFGRPILDGFEATLSAAFIGTWTAFEVMVGDLWEHSLNSRLSLVFVSLGIKPEELDNDEGKKSENISARSLLKKMSNPGFDPAKCMGTLLREQYPTQWDFAHRREATANYFKTFPLCKDELAKILNTDELKWLCEIRNVLVHHGGIANHRFWQNVQGHNGLKATVQIKKKFVPNGKILDEFIRAMITQATKLLTFVDRWLGENPK